MKKELLVLLKKLNLIPADKENEITAEIDKLDLDKKSDPPIDPSKITDPVMKQIADQNLAMSAQIKSLTEALTAERTEREKGIKVQQDEAKKSADAKVAALVAQALKEGKIVKAGEADFKALVEGSYTFAENWLKSAPVDKSFKPEQKNEKDGKESVQAKPTSMKTYMENRAENTQELASILAPSKN